MKKTMKKCINVFVLIGALFLTGCTLFGKQPTQPTPLEKSLFTEITNLVAKPVLVTNIVTFTNTETRIVEVPGATTIVTNTLMVSVPYNVTNVMVVTQQVPIVQLAPSAKTDAIVKTGESIGSLFGFGGLVSTLLAGLLATYLKLRNNNLSGEADVATQASVVLVQNIETLVEILKTTPQGQAALPSIKNYLMTHQSQVGVIEYVANVVKETVDTPAAKQAANAILTGLQNVKS
jgi:hypothetical protein